METVMHVTFSNKHWQWYINTSWSCCLVSLSFPQDQYSAYRMRGITWYIGAMFLASCLLVTTTGSIRTHQGKSPCNKLIPMNKSVMCSSTVQLYSFQFNRFDHHDMQNCKLYDHKHKKNLMDDTCLRYATTFSWPRNITSSSVLGPGQARYAGLLRCAENRAAPVVM